MPEIYPRITYSPEGILELNQFKKSDGNFKYSTTEHTLETISVDSRCQVRESEDEISVQMDVRGVLESINDDSRYGSPEFGRIIEQLAPLAYFDYEDKRDGVFSLDWWGNNGATGVVYAHLQRWMNTDLFTEEVARGIYDAMAEPYGQSVKERIPEWFNYRKYSNGVSAGDGGMSINVALLRDEFCITPIGDETDNETVTVKWKWPNLSTVGSCACWGVDGNDRADLLLDLQTSRLYEMHPHNVDAPIQSLSLVLGMARMAFEATKYDGNEDIFRNISSKE